MTYAIPEQLSAANKANMDALLTFANTAFTSTERLTALNLSAARSVMEDTMDNARILMTVKEVKDLTNIPATIYPNIIEKAITYSRNIYEIATQTNKELSKVFEAQYMQINKNMSSALDKAENGAPVGTDLAIAVVKSALAATQTAYDNINKAAKQAAEIAEAASSVAIKTAGTTSSKMSRRAA
ncbi:MAG: phasin family protein [Rhodocyclaceae bacterium]|nr:MAG: phasin family protein [Rhodocyclaceae bacterium]